MSNKSLISRRSFFKKAITATMPLLSIPILGTILTSCGEDEPKLPDSCASAHVRARVMAHAQTPALVHLLGVADHQEAEGAVQHLETEEIAVNCNVAVVRAVHAKALVRKVVTEAVSLPVH